MDSLSASFGIVFQNAIFVFISAGILSSTLLHKVVFLTTREEEFQILTHDKTYKMSRITFLSIS